MLCATITPAVNIGYCCALFKYDVTLDEQIDMWQVATTLFDGLKMMGAIIAHFLHPVLIMAYSIPNEKPVTLHSLLSK